MKPHLLYLLRYVFARSVARYPKMFCLDTGGRQWKGAAHEEGLPS